MSARESPIGPPRQRRFEKQDIQCSLYHVAAAHWLSLIATHGYPPYALDRETGDDDKQTGVFLAKAMAGAGSCCSILSFEGNSRTSWLVLNTPRRANASRNWLKRRSLQIRAEINYVNAEEAKNLVAVEGYTVLDIRDKTQFERAHIKQCYHAPLFIENQDNDLGTVVKRTVHNNFAGLFFGLAFTKLNPDFVQSVKTQFSPDSKLLLVCQEGLRSSAAANQLGQAGYQNVACLTSGLQSVKPGTFDSVGSTELQDAGKAGLVTIQGKISAVLGTVLICAYLFITFFPDQAERLFQLAPSS